MPDLGIILDKAWPLKADGSLPDPITRAQLEQRLMRIGVGAAIGYVDNAQVTGAVQALADFGCIRFSGANGGGATRIPSDIVHRTVTTLGPARSRFGPPPGHGTKQAITDEFGKDHDFPIGEQADAEVARVLAVRRQRRVDQIKADLAE